MNTFKLYNITINATLAQLVGPGSGAIGSSGTSYIIVYGGTPPTAAQFATWVVTSLPATKLITFLVSGLAASPSAGTSSINNIPLVTATNSGIATWFVIYNAAGAADSIVMGDISNLAGTGAYRLNDTTIVSGKSYSMQNFSMTVPNTFTF